MSSVNLDAEMDSAGRAVAQVHLDRLRAFGVSFGTLADLGEHYWPFGVTSAEPVGLGLYQPGEGAIHVVLPVVEDGALIDLVAFRPTSPDEWMLRTGYGFALGLSRGWSPWLWYSPADPDAKPPKYQVGQPLHLYSNPLDWLQGGCGGVCVVDWGSPDVRQLAGLDAVTVTDEATGRLLGQALSRPVRLPRIEITGGLANVA